MSREELIICDACGCSAATSQVGKYHWDQKPSKFCAHCPEDGVNGGVWSMDVCAFCRRIIYAAIRQTIDELRAGIHQEQQLPDDLA